MRGPLMWNCCQIHVIWKIFVAKNEIFQQHLKYKVFTIKTAICMASLEKLVSEIQHNSHENTHDCVFPGNILSLPSNFDGTGFSCK